MESKIRPDGIDKPPHLSHLRLESPSAHPIQGEAESIILKRIRENRLFNRSMSIGPDGAGIDLIPPRIGFISLRRSSLCS